MVRISIITVTFNRAHVLRDTIQSVLSQNYKNYEYIIVDGASDDGTVELLKEYEPMFEGRMRWISEKDHGLYDAINKGIRMATGDVVGIINSDDFFHRTDVFNIVSAVFDGDRSVQAIYGDIRFVDPDNLGETVRYYSSKYWRPWHLRFGIMPAHPSFYTYRENFEKYGYYRTDFHIAADYDLLIRHLYKHADMVKYVPQDFLKMRKGGKSTSGLKANLLINKEVIRCCKENGIWTCMPFIFCKYFIKAFGFLFRKNR